MGPRVARKWLSQDHIQVTERGVGPSCTGVCVAYFTGALDPGVSGLPRGGPVGAKPWAGFEWAEEWGHSKWRHIGGENEEDMMVKYGKAVSKEWRIRRRGILRDRWGWIFHSFHKCLLGSYYMPGIVNISVNKPMQPLYSCNRYFIGWRWWHKLTRKLSETITDPDKFKERTGAKSRSNGMGTYLNRVANEGLFGKVTSQLRKGRDYVRQSTPHVQRPWDGCFREGIQSQVEEGLVGVVSSEVISDSLEQRTFPSIPGWSSEFSCIFPSVHWLTSQSSHPKVMCLPQPAPYLQLCFQLSKLSQTVAKPLILPSSFSHFYPFFGLLSRPGRQQGTVVQWVTHNKHFGSTQTRVQMPTLPFSELHQALVFRELYLAGV